MPADISDGLTLAAVVAQVRDLQNEMEKLNDVRRDVAALKIENAALKSKYNATVSLFEHRIDQIYQNISILFNNNQDDPKAICLSLDSEVERRMADIISGGLQEVIDPDSIKIDDILSGTITPGLLGVPLTLYGFRLNRAIAVEQGASVRVAGTGVGIAVYGPYKRLKPGLYTLRAYFAVEDSAPSDVEVVGHVELDVYSQQSAAVIATTTLSANLMRSSGFIELVFDWTPQHSAGTVEFRLHQYSSLTILLQKFMIEIT